MKLRGMLTTHVTNHQLVSISLTTAHVPSRITKTSLSLLKVRGYVCRAEVSRRARRPGRWSWRGRVFSKRETETCFLLNYGVEHVGVVDDYLAWQ